MPLILQTKRLQVSPLVVEDLDAFVGYRQDPAVAKFQSWDPGFSKDQGLELIRSQSGFHFPPVGEWLQLGIRDLTSGQLVGDLALHSLEQDRSYEIGFTIAREHQGKGFGREAAVALLEYLFEQMRADCVQANTDCRNQVSIRLLESLGFSQLVDRSWVEEFKGETVTVYVFEVTRSAWA